MAQPIRRTIWVVTKRGGYILIGHPLHVYLSCSILVASTRGMSLIESLSANETLDRMTRSAASRAFQRVVASGEGCADSSTRDCYSTTSTFGYSGTSLSSSRGCLSRHSPPRTRRGCASFLRRGIGLDRESWMALTFLHLSLADAHGGSSCFISCSGQATASPSLESTSHFHTWRLISTRRQPIAQQRSRRSDSSWTSDGFADYLVSMNRPWPNEEG